MTDKNLDEAKKAIDDYWRIRNEIEEECYLNPLEKGTLKTIRLGQRIKEAVKKFRRWVRNGI